MIEDGNLNVNDQVVEGNEEIRRLIVEMFGSNEPTCLYPILNTEGTGDELHIGVQYTVDRHLVGLVHCGSQIFDVKAKLKYANVSEGDAIIGVAKGGERGTEVFLVVKGDVEEILEDLSTNDCGLNEMVRSWVHEEAVRVVLNEWMRSDDFSRAQLLELIKEMNGNGAGIKAKAQWTFRKSYLGIGVAPNTGDLEVVCASEQFLADLVKRLGLGDSVQNYERFKIGGPLYDQLAEKYGADMSAWPAEAVLYPIVLYRMIREMIVIGTFRKHDLSRLFGDEQLNIENLLENGSYLVFFSPENNANAGHDINNK